MSNRETFYVPANGVLEDANDLLIRGGFLRQVILHTLHVKTEANSIICRLILACFTFFLLGCECKTNWNV